MMTTTTAAKVILILALCSVSKSVPLRATVTFAMDSSGLEFLRYGATNFLASGTFRMSQATFLRDDGTTFTAEPAQVTSTSRFARSALATASWGTVDIRYRTSGNKLSISMTVTNRSHFVLQGLWLQPLELQFPSKLKEYDDITPLLTSSEGQPPVVFVNYNGGKIAIVAEDRQKNMQIGLPWAANRPQSTIFPISLNTGRVDSFPDSTPTIDRPITPGQSDTFEFSIRFGPPDASAEDLAGDVYSRFVQDSPVQLKWSDRRPIGALFLSTAAAGWPSNPRGWLQDSHVDTTTETGIATLRKRLLDYADGSIQILKSMNAQGMITWDIEGQQFPHAISYVGDPRQFDVLAPEMRDIADEYFLRFRRAGLRVGVCIRPQSFQLTPDGAHQDYLSDPTNLLIDKVRWAKERWGVSLVYIDSNVRLGHVIPLAASIMKRLALEFPDILFIPEHATLNYYAYAAPYRELRQGYVGTAPEVRNIYRTAFSVVYIADGPLSKRSAEVEKSVAAGDVLLFRAWFYDPQNEIVKRIYQAAERK